MSVRLGPSELGDGYSNVDISVRVYQGGNESMKALDQSYVSQKITYPPMTTGRCQAGLEPGVTGEFATLRIPVCCGLLQYNNTAFCVAVNMCTDSNRVVYFIKKIEDGVSLENYPPCVEKHEKLYYNESNLGMYDQDDDEPVNGSWYMVRCYENSTDTPISVSPEACDYFPTREPTASPTLSPSAAPSSSPTPFPTKSLRHFRGMEAALEEDTRRAESVIKSR